MLRLPAYQDLSREQIDIYNLPLRGSHLVIGPPGTGKTIMALHRAAMYRHAGLATRFLVYSNPLTQYLAQAVRQEHLQAVTHTFHSWFKWWYRKNIGCFPPQTAPFVFDWLKALPEISARCSVGKPLERYEHVVVDEGQDFPREFYVVLRLLTDNITVFADENQRLTDTNSTLKQIRGYLALTDTQVHTLTRNYRNTRPIAEFSACFYAGLRSGLPLLPSRGGPKPRLMLDADLRAQIRYIARYERNNADRDIAVFVEKNGQQQQIFDMLSDDPSGTANLVQMYMSKDQNHRKLDFGSRGIKILTYASAKGLEFDTVFLPLMERCRAKPESEFDKMRFYVMTSRARQEVILLSAHRAAPPILQPVSESLYTIQNLR